MCRQALAVVAGLLSAAALVRPALADPSTVVSLLLPYFDQQTVLGSVIAAGPTATSYFIKCPDATDQQSAQDCGIGTGLTIVQGPSTLEIHLTDSDSVAGQLSTAQLDISCVLSSNTATCTESFHMQEGTSPVSNEVDTTVMTGYSTALSPVTITAGAEKLTAGGAAATGASRAAAFPRITQPAVLMGGVVAVVGGVMMV